MTENPAVEPSSMESEDPPIVPFTRKPATSSDRGKRKRRRKWQERPVDLARTARLFNMSTSYVEAEVTVHSAQLQGVMDKVACDSFYERCQIVECGLYASGLHRAHKAMMGLVDDVYGHIEELCRAELEWLEAEMTRVGIDGEAVKAIPKTYTIKMTTPLVNRYVGVVRRADRILLCIDAVALSVCEKDPQQYLARTRGFERRIRALASWTAAQGSRILRLVLKTRRKTIRSDKADMVFVQWCKDERAILEKKSKLLSRRTGADGCHARAKTAEKDEGAGGE